uniref:N-acetylglucosaminylphosphatidylinositol deacetylase n=1 Tax=Panagrolaimus sp. JU765 TaxID=591449 RepID=A0AC34RTF9_9BILA
MWYLSLIVLLILPIWWFCYNFQRKLPIKDGGRCLLIIAHPDDETMFFGPTLLKLIESNVKVFVLSITTGNFDGIGNVRKKELSNAIQMLGLSSDNLTILDMKEYSDGPNKWEIEKLSKIILQYMETLDCDAAITFDSGGISGHPNHISCFLALQFLYTNGLLPINLQVFILETVKIWRKYSSIFDLIPSFFLSTFFIVSSPKSILTIYSAMKQHYSQLVWFRFLYLIFSRYIFVNSLKRIPLHRYCTKK